MLIYNKQENNPKSLQQFAPGVEKSKLKWICTLFYLQDLHAETGRIVILKDSTWKSYVVEVSRFHTNLRELEQIWE